MGMESNTGLGIQSQYGPRTVEGKYGGEVGDDVIKVVVFDISFEDLNSTSARAVNGLDYVIPAGSSMIDFRYVVDTAVVGPTAITAGLYLASDGTTAVDADGLMTAAVGVVTALDAAGDVVLGTGALLATGTGAGYALTARTVVRILPTVAAATAGKLRAYLTYFAPQP